MPKSIREKTDKTLTVRPSPTTEKRAAILMLLTILDTTWRAFVPTVGGTFIGIGLDNLTNKAPIFTSIFIILGFMTAGLLVALQLRRVRNAR
jgi:F0F1-type ATP synthase assembly protein I